MGQKTDAIITELNNNKHEVRCGLCGKLLFTINGKLEKDIDFSKQNVIIVARCTRSQCKADNNFFLVQGLYKCE